MAKKRIDDLTLNEINRAVAIAHGWRIGAAGGVAQGHLAWINSENQAVALVASYSPATLHHDCGMLIDDCSINTRRRFFNQKKFDWYADIGGSYQASDESRLVAACKSFLYFSYPDGIVEIGDEKTNS